MLLRLVLPLMLAATGIESFVFSCPEVKYRLINSARQTFGTTYACVVVQEGFTNWDELKIISVGSGDVYHNFKDIFESATSCVQRSSNVPWKVTEQIGASIDCSQQFTLIFTSTSNGIFTPLTEVYSHLVSDDAITLVVPETGMWLHKKSCQVDGSVTVYTGAGTGEREERYKLQSWTCSSLPEWILSFDDALTIEADAASKFDMEVSSDLTFDSRIMVSEGDRLVILNSGRSDDLQNIQGGIEHRACIQMADFQQTLVTMSMQLQFDTRNNGYIVLQKIFQGSEYKYYNGTYDEKFKSEYFEVRYVPERIEPINIWNSRDNMIIDIKIGYDDPPPPTTTKVTPTTTTSTPTEEKDGYCNCAVDKFGFPDGWKFIEIWLDIVVILDASEAMGEEALEDARELIESFISDGIDDFLITDTTAPFYTRVGVIMMDDTPNVLYNLNMTKKDKVQASIKKGLSQIDIIQAFETAEIMLNDGVKSIPDRANTRRVIYFMSDSEPKDSLSATSTFKETGVIIVNNFLKEGETERQGLKQLASDGFYYSSNNYLQELQVFCKANCFCHPDKASYGGADPALRASGGCYHPVTAGVPFNKAKTACADGGGVIATVHDDEKGRFVQQLMSKGKSDYYWIGYEKSNEGAWQWEDQSTDPYTNWDVNEPSSTSVAKCAYVDSSDSKLPWGAGNCQLGFPYACQYVPCSVGNKNC